MEQGNAWTTSTTDTSNTTTHGTRNTEQAPARSAKTPGRDKQQEAEAMRKAYGDGESVGDSNDTIYIYITNRATQMRNNAGNS